MFTADPYGDGYVVVEADTGRPMTFKPRSYQSAAATARILNEAAKDGARALARALGATDDDEDDVFRGVKF